MAEDTYAWTFLVSTLISYAAVIATSIWVFVDARLLRVRKGQVGGFADASPVGWLFGCLLLWIVCFPMYLVQRPKYVRASRMSTGRNFCDQCAEPQRPAARFCPRCGAP